MKKNIIAQADLPEGVDREAFEAVQQIIAKQLGVATEDVSVDKKGYINVVGHGRKGQIIVQGCEDPTHNHNHTDDDDEEEDEPLDIITVKGKRYVAVDDAKQLNDEMLDVVLEMNKLVLEMVDDIGGHLVDLAKALKKGTKQIGQLKSKEIENK